MKIIRAKFMDPTDTGVYVKLSNLEALLLRNMCANLATLPGHQLLTGAAQSMRKEFSSLYPAVNPPMCSSNYKFMEQAEFRMQAALDVLGDY